jgi:hypothetical protein
MPVRTPSRQVLVLAALVVALVAVLVYEFRGQGEPARGGQPAVAKPDPLRRALARDRPESVPDVRLSALKARKSSPAEKGRNLFRELPKTPPPLPPQRVAAPPAAALDPNAPPPAPPPPPPPPPITLKLVAIVQGAGRPLAALSDGRDVFYGREGEVIEGRYKIIKINVESIDISYLDGRGQRRLSLTG